MAKQTGCGVLATLALFLAVPPVAAQGEGRAAVIGYASNYQSFSFYREKYRTTSAEADSVDDAAAGRWRNAVSVTTLHIVDGKFERLERDAPPPAPPKKKPGSSGTSIMTSAFTGMRYLSGEVGAVHNAPFIKTADLYERDDPEFGFTTATPLTLGIVGWRSRRGPDWMQSNPEIMAEQELGRKVIDGASLIGMRYTKRDDGTVFEFWFDRARGYLPIRITRALAGKEGQGTQVRILAARDCGNGRWFPERILSTSPQSGTGGVRVSEMLVLELDTDNRPKPGDFVIQLASGTEVKMRRDSSRAIRLKQEETVSARDLPELFEMTQKAPSQPFADTGLTHRRGWSWKVWTAVGFGIALILLGLVWTVRRRRAVPVAGSGA